MNTVIVKIEAVGTSRTRAVDAHGKDYSHEMPSYKRKQIGVGNYAVRKEGSTGRTFWRNASKADWDATAPVVTTTDDISEDHKAVLDFIHSSYKLKPKGLIMNEIKWKYLIRSAARGKNIMMTGPAGCGKTMAAKSLVDALDLSLIHI